MLFRGVHYEICCIDRKGYEWVIQTTKKLKSAAKLDFILEAIHIMVPGETEEEFDKRIESYRALDNA